MNRDELEAMANAWAHEGVAGGRTERFDDWVAADAIDHSGPRPSVGPEGFKARTRAIHAAFEAIEVTVTDLVAEGDRVAWRWTLTALHRGPFLGVAPTGRRITMAGVNFQRVARGRVVEHWSLSDQLGLLRQLEG